MVWDSQNPKGQIYIDGQLEAVYEPFELILPEPIVSFYIAGHAGWRIDDLVILKKALTAQQIQNYFEKNQAHTGNWAENYE